MQPGTLTTVARTSAVVLVIIVAAALGLFVGDALRDRGGSALDAGNAAAPVSRTADTSFSLEAIAALAAIRDTSAATAAAADDYPDYSLRHPAASTVAEDYPDYSLRHPAAPYAVPTSPSGATLE